MSDANRLRYLRVALIAVGLIFVFGIYPLGMVWPAGWKWGQGHSHYLMMIVGLYATLGVFLLIASKNPAAPLVVAIVLAVLTPCGRAAGTARG